MGSGAVLGDFRPFFAVNRAFSGATADLRALATLPIDLDDFPAILLTSLAEVADAPFVDLRAVLLPRPQ